jgi:hypothetical protein
VLIFSGFHSFAVSIPRVDNSGMFQALHQALESGGAVTIFPGEFSRPLLTVSTFARLDHRVPSASDFYFFDSCFVLGCGMPDGVRHVEGTTQLTSGLMPLKTGCARIALAFIDKVIRSAQCNWPKCISD